MSHLLATLAYLVQARQSCGVGEVIGPNSVGCAEALDYPDHPYSIMVRIRVCDESRWYAVVAAIATAVRMVSGVIMVVRLDRISELDFDVPPWVPATQRYHLLSAALQAATSALHTHPIHSDWPTDMHRGGMCQNSRHKGEAKYVDRSALLQSEGLVVL